MAEVKHYEEEPFRFQFIPAGDPFKGNLYVQTPELSPYSQQVNLSSPDALRRYARNAAEQRGFNEESLRAALQEVATIRHEEVTAAIEAEENSRGEISNDTSSDADVLVGYTEDVELSHTREEKTHATLRVEDHGETLPVEGKRFNQWLRRRFYEDVGKAPGATVLQSAVDTIAAQALFEGHEEPVFRRVAGHEGAVYLDLCNEACEAVEITLSGWRVVSEPPVKFVRSEGSAPLPYPETGGSVEELRPFLNLADDDSDEDFKLTTGWCIGALNPTGPYPVLEIVGEQGTAKSTTVELLRSLVDPATPPLRPLPSSERDLVIAASRRWILAFDNLSYIKPETSDAMCRLSTGGGFGTRTLYTDDEETIFEATRPQVVNGINTIAVRGDLQERALSIILAPIPPEERRRESEFWASFEAVRPRILGALLDAVSGALREVENLKPESLPRMADFALWVSAAETSLGWESGSFIEAYSENRLSATASALEGDPVAMAIRKLLQAPGHDGEWSGTAQELLDKLNYRTDEDVKRSKTWPKAANALSRAMNRLAPLLRVSGIEYRESEEGHDRRKVKTLRLVETEEGEATVRRRA